MKQMAVTMMPSQELPVKKEAVDHEPIMQLYPVEEELVKEELVMQKQEVMACRMLGPVNGRSDFDPTSDLVFDAEGKLARR